MTFRAHNDNGKGLRRQRRGHTKENKDEDEDEGVEIIRDQCRRNNRKGWGHPNREGRGKGRHSKKMRIRVR